MLLLLFADVTNDGAAGILAVDRVLLDKLLSHFIKEFPQIMFIEREDVLHAIHSLLEELAAEDNKVITSEEVSAVVHS